VSETDVHAESAEIDGRVLLEQGRTARAQRREDKTLKSRLARYFEDKPVWARYAVVFTGLVTALLFAAVAIDVAASHGRIHPGVWVGDVRLGAMAPQRAAEQIDTSFGPRVTQPITLIHEEYSWDVDPGRLGVVLETEAMVEEAMSIGRTGSLADRARTRARLWFAPEILAVRVAAEATAVAEIVETVVGTVEREPKDASLVIEGTEVRLESAVLGVSVRREALRDGILAAFSAADRDVEVQVEFTPVRVTDEDARQALADARALLAGPAVVNHATESWEFSVEEIAGWIDFRTRPVTSQPATSATSAEVTGAKGAPADPGEGGVPLDSDRVVLEAFISPEKARELVIERVGKAARAPKDARFKTSGGTVTIVPSEYGAGPDVEALAVELTRALTTGSDRVADLQMSRIEPELTTEEAQAMGISERIATFTTTYAASNRPRVNNIHTLARALDGTLVGPGETFSLNETIGPRTAARGYQEAPAIINGRLVPSLGGGICQVATTIFNTVFESGLPVVERRNHSFYISSYPNGRDAAVAWGGPDFKFKNDTGHWVLIATSFTNSSVTVSLYGTDPEYTVKAVPGPFTDVVPYTTEKIEDPNLPLGTNVVVDPGTNGRRIVVKRTVTRNGDVIRQDSFTSVYRPKQQLVRVGTKVEQSVVGTVTAPP